MWLRAVFPALLLFSSTLAFAGNSNEPIVIREIHPLSWERWAEVSGGDFIAIADDDIQRHIADESYFEGIKIDQRYIRENGFVWHLLRFTNIAKPVGPLWMVPHDDENAAFEGGIAALKRYGGVAVVVNSGPGSARRQTGNGTCGVRNETVTSCDPNRNFADASPIFTSAFLDQLVAGQPVIALHTNSYGFSGDRQGGRGEITILDVKAFQRGKTQPRSGGHFAINPTANMANYDTLALMAYLAPQLAPSLPAVACRKVMTEAGVHFWHERVERSDGSMSNYLALNYAHIQYFNAESRLETDLDVAAGRHALMIDAYLIGCGKSGNQPVP
jgi:hypothetical protein